MNAEVKKKWVDALRSGKYRQGRMRLRVVDPNGDKFCCLGVRCDMVDPSGWRDEPKEDFVDGEATLIRFHGMEMAAPSRSLIAKIGGLTRDWLVYASKNDIEDKTFEEIADFVEANE